LIEATSNLGAAGYWAASEAVTLQRTTNTNRFIGGSLDGNVG
jgi:hypothetical protein